MAKDKVIGKYGERVGYTGPEIEMFHEGGHRVRHVLRLSRATAKYSIKAEVVKSKNCNSGHTVGQTLILDVDGNLISKLCPKKTCIYLISQLTIPVALINERLSEGLEPDHFHFMRYVRCPDTGVDCYGYGEVMLKVQVVPRVKKMVTREGPGKSINKAENP
jgi:uncharacterized repeat protein (TIGR04076 family)